MPLWFYFVFLTGSNIDAEPIRILILGDSLTAGYGVRPQYAYPALVENRLKEAGIDVAVINGGVSGDTTAAGLRRLNWQLRTNPDLLVVALGGNDMLRAIPPKASLENLRRIALMAKERKLHMALMSISAAPNLGEDFEREFNSIFPMVSKEFKVPLLKNFIEGVAGKFELNLPDGIHPNGKGHEIIAMRVSDFLLPLIQRISNDQKRESPRSAPPQQDLRPSRTPSSSTPQH